MRFILIPLPPHLPIRWYKISPKRKVALTTKTTHSLRTDYFKKNGSWVLLKKWLANVSGQKCWYCEAKLIRAPYDVDHFRPKLGITVDGVKLNGDSGYYWLAYEWWNFRLSCQRCNRPEKDESGTLRGKANEFPLQDEAKRSRQPADSLGAELPRLLDPCVQADCELLAHGTDGEVKPAAPQGTWDYERASYTIELLGFNAWDTPETKRKYWQQLDILIRIAGNDPSVLIQLQKHLSYDHEYSIFFRSAIGTYRNLPWVNALL